LDCDSGKFSSANPTQPKFKEAAHLPRPGEACGVFKRQKFATGIFKTEFMSFLDKNKKRMPNHFWFSHS